MKSLLPLLFLLICPIAMMFMMRGMHGHGSHKGPADPTEAEDRMSAAELRHLRDDVKTRMTELDTRIEAVETAHAVAKSADAREVHTS